GRPGIDKARHVGWRASIERADGVAPRGGRQVGLLGYLAADLAAFVGGRVDVHVPLAGQQLLRLSIGERGRTLERALGGGPGEDRDHDAGVLAGRGGPVEVGGGRRATQVGIGALVAELLGGGVIGRGDIALALALVRRHFVLGVHVRLEVDDFGEGRCDKRESGRAGDRRQRRPKKRRVHWVLLLKISGRLHLTTG